MAIFKITSGTALAPFTLSSNIVAGSAFFSDTAAADTLTVELGAFLISTASSGAFLTAGSGNWTVSVAGLVQGQSYGLFVGSPSAAITVTEDGAVKGVTSHGIQFGGGGSFTLNNKGTIAGSGNAIFMTSATSTVTNSGDIFGDIFQVFNASNDTLTNSGNIEGNVSLNHGTNKITNSGNIYGAVSGGDGADTVANTGFIDGTVTLGNGTNILTNSKLATIGVTDSLIGVSFSGGINDDKITNDGRMTGYVYAGEGTNALTNTGRIGVSTFTSFSYSAVGTGKDTIINKGEMEGGIALGNGANSVDNSGTVGGISSSSYSNTNLSVVGGNDGDIVKNSKTFSGAVWLQGGTNSLTNSGTIGVAVGGTGTSYLGLDGGDTVVNSLTGHMGGRIDLGSGTNKLTNGGFIGADVTQISVTGGSGSDTVSNTKTISGSVTLGNGINSFTNSGVVGDGGGSAYVGGAGNDTVTNSGRLTGNIQLWEAADISLTVKGLNLLTNSGQIEGSVFGNFNNDKVDNKASGIIFSSVFLGDGANTLLNAGFIDGIVTSGGGVDTVTNTGTIVGLVDLGDGDDKYTGGSFVDQVKDGLGKDTIALGGGNDLFLAVDSGNGDSPLDNIDGGLGVDTYDASGLFNVNINLGTTDHTAPVGLQFLPNSLVKNQASGFGETDLVFNFENVIGTGSSDTIVGSSAVNVLQGGGSSDDLFGNAGNDKLDGGSSSDFIVGGLGADILTGGADGDVFWYFNTNESGRSALARDTITDFVVGVDGDVINLSAIDANSLVAGDQAFSFINTNVVWGGAAGELRALWTATGQVVEGDVNGDKVSDFSIFIADGGTHVALSAANGVDFIL